jgi:hypothetical protein
MYDRHDDRIEIESLLGQNVFVPLGPGLVWHPTQNTVTHQLLEPLCEQMPGHSEPRLEILETAHAQEAVPQDEKRPAVADDRDGAGNGARLLLE